MFRELESQMKQANFDMDRELYPESLERSWSHLIMLYKVSCSAATLFSNFFQVLASQSLQPLKAPL